MAKIFEHVYNMDAGKLQAEIKKWKQWNMDSEIHDTSPKRTAPLTGWIQQENKSE